MKLFDVHAINKYMATVGKTYNIEVGSSLCHVTYIGNTATHLHRSIMNEYFCFRKEIVFDN